MTEFHVRELVVLVPTFVLGIHLVGMVLAEFGFHELVVVVSRISTGGGYACGTCHQKRLDALNLRTPLWPWGLPVSSWGQGGF